MGFNIVILTGKAGSMKQAETFLRNRNWNIFSTPNLRDCIAAVVKMRPDFVLIAADHPNRKVKTLPKLLSQAISVKVIAFVETTNGISMGALNEMKMEYNLYPPVSGPAIERMCLKIRKEEEDVKNGVVKQREVKAAPPSASEQVMNRIPERKDMGPSRVKISGSNPQNKAKTLDDFENFLDDAASAPVDEVYFAKGNASRGPGSAVQQGTGPGEKLSGTAGGAETTDDDFNLESELAALMKENSAKGSSSGGPGAAYLPAQDGNSNSSGAGYTPNHSGPGGDAGQRNSANGNKKKHYSELDTGDDKSTTDKQKPKFGNEIPERKELEQPNFGGAAKKNQSSAKQFDEESQSHDPYAADWATDDDGNPIEKKESENPFQSRSRTKGVQSVPTSERTQKSTPVLESDPIFDKRKDIPKYKQDPKHYPDQESIFVRGTQQALDEASKMANPLGEYQEVEGSTHVACLTITSKKFSGYLVAAMGKNQKIDQNFMKTVRDKLYDFLRSHGEVMQDTDPMDLSLQEVQFEDWAISQADFLRKSVHGSSEVAMAFFPSKETTARLEASVTENMLKMSLEELKDDVPVEFDLFIYMPSNNRFLLYTPQGRPIYGEQRGRLKEKGVTHIHLRADASGQVKKYRAQVFLNEKISELKNKRRAG